MNNHIVLGMAGHIDHGKTAIVKGLTGRDTDRLKEEKERGMTTDLGFAFLGKDITVIDVPGHERFVKTMVAGVNTIDMVVLVIAADDGVMPQTKEHFEILNLLRVKKGLIAVNKIDIVDEDWLELIIDDIKDMTKGTFLENAPIVPVSAVKNIGMDLLKKTINDVAETVQERPNKGVFRLPIDRVFTIKGFGTVIAGTVLSGSVSPDDIVELLPSEEKVRVRGVQVHDKPVESATIGYRAAVNLGKIEKDAITRGDVLAESGYFKPTYMIDGHFELLKSWDREMKNQHRVRVHLGTNEVIARVVLLDKEVLLPGESGFIQIRFEKPVVADIGDRFVLRNYSPMQTMGGGEFLDVAPVKHKRFKDDVNERLTRLLDGDPHQLYLEYLSIDRFVPKALDDISKSLGVTKDDVSKTIATLEESERILWVGKKRVMTRDNFDLLESKILTTLEHLHDQNPMKYAFALAKLKLSIKLPVDKVVFDILIKKFQEDGRVTIKGDQVRSPEKEVVLPHYMKELESLVMAFYEKEPYNPPKIADVVTKFGENVHPLMDYLVESSKMVQMDKEVYFLKSAVVSAQESMKKFEKLYTEGCDLTDMRECLEGSTRKRLVLLLEYFDRTKFTVREGDLRKLAP